MNTCPDYREYREQDPELEVLSFHDVSARDQKFSSTPQSKVNDTYRDARIVVYESPIAPPRVIDVPFTNAVDYIETITTTVHTLCRQQGTDLPYTIIRPLAENLIHADFNEPVISLAKSGRSLSFADQGLGITHKDLACVPGFSSANSAMKEIIAGVGSGLPTVSYYAEQSGGQLDITDNLKGGTVITLRLPEPVPVAPAAPTTITTPVNVPTQASLVAPPQLSDRQKEVLALVSDCGTCGPSRVSDLLGISLATAFRDLKYLVSCQLLSDLPDGKRLITSQGLAYLDRYVFGKKGVAL